MTLVSQGTIFGLQDVWAAIGKRNKRQAATGRFAAFDSRYGTLVPFRYLRNYRLAIPVRIVTGSFISWAHRSNKKVRTCYGFFS